MAVLLDEAVAAAPEGAAIVDARGTTTWAALAERTHRLVHALRDRGLAEGDTIVVETFIPSFTGGSGGGNQENPFGTGGFPGGGFPGGGEFPGGGSGFPGGGAPGGGMRGNR